MKWLRKLLGARPDRQAMSADESRESETAHGEAQTPQRAQEPAAARSPALDLISKALLTASSSGNVEHAKSLLERGASPNTRSDFDVTPLMRASRAGHVDVVKVLLDAGADINATANSGGTALLWAIESGHINVVRLLLRRGADPNVKEHKTGQTAQVLAQKKGHQEIAALFKQREVPHAGPAAETSGVLRRASQVAVFLGRDCSTMKNGLGSQAEAYVCASTAHAARTAILSAMSVDHITNWVVIYGFDIPGNAGKRCSKKQVNAWGRKFDGAFRSQKERRFASLDITIVGDVATSTVSVWLRSQGCAVTACECCDALENAGRTLGV